MVSTTGSPRRITLLGLLSVVVTLSHVRRVSPTPTSLGLLETEIIPPAQHSIPFFKVPRSPGARTRSLRGRGNSNYNNANALSGVYNDDEYAVNVTIGGQNFSLIIDTGSSDAWVIGKGFTCLGGDGTPVPESECEFGTDGYDPSLSKTYESIPNENFDTSYVDAEYLIGVPVLDTITIGGLTVPSQEFGLVSQAGWVADNVTSGLLGLAFPSITSEFHGTNTSDDTLFTTNTSQSNAAHYDPFFFTAVKDGLVSKPYFSVALDRPSNLSHEAGYTYDPNLGYLAFGGIAPVTTLDIAVTVPIVNFTWASGESLLSLWNVNVTYNFEGSFPPTSPNSAAGTLDTGTSLNYIPPELAAAYNARFNPPALDVPDLGTFFVQCNATIPPFSITIGGVVFTLDPKDLVLHQQPAYYYEGYECISGIQAGGDFGGITGWAYILGLPFLHNVVATFNIEKNTATIAQRVPY